MAKATPAKKEETLTPEQMQNMITAMAKKIDQLQNSKQEEVDDTPSPENARTSNQGARLLATSVGDVIQPEGYVTPVPEAIMEKGPNAVKVFLDTWKKGQRPEERALGGHAEELAAEAAM